MDITADLGIVEFFHINIGDFLCVHVHRFILTARGKVDREMSMHTHTQTYTQYKQTNKQTNTFTHTHARTHTHTHTHTLLWPPRKSTLSPWLNKFNLNFFHVFFDVFERMGLFENRIRKIQTKIKTTSNNEVHNHQYDQQTTPFAFICSSFSACVYLSVCLLVCLSVYFHQSILPSSICVSFLDLSFFLSP